MVGVVTAEWWNEEESPVWRRENASDCLRVIKWLQAWALKWFLTSDGGLYVYMRDMSAPMCERQETVGEGCSLRHVKGGDVEVLAPDPSSVPMGSMEPSPDRDLIRAVLAMKLRTDLPPTAEDLAWLTSALVGVVERARS